MLFANINAVALAKSAGTNPWGGGFKHGPFSDHQIPVRATCRARRTMKQSYQLKRTNKGTN